ncbi:MAG: CPBP family intramembrane metalloprotease [Verrucomicrobiae bacterium]|nr:CPBP family intramembrane metalloprotease [Verrucomicrobiae bacterium]
MRPVRAILIYLLVIFVGSALIAPPLYFIVNQFSDSLQFCNYLISKGFHKFLSRSMIFIAVVGLIPLLRSLGFKSVEETGFAPFKTHWKKLCYGFLFGLATLSIPVLASFVLGAVSSNTERTLSQIARHFLNAGLSAIVVSFIEELVFRGGVLGSTQRFYGWRFGIIFSSAIYAIVHFFAKIERLADVHWYSGFVGILTMLRGFGDFKALIPGFLNLFLVGVILSLFFKRTGNLYFSIGIHAGWIFWLKTYGFFAVFGERHNVWFFGSSKLIDGWITFGVLLPTTLLLVYLFRESKSKWGATKQQHIDNKSDTIK